MRELHSHIYWYGQIGLSNARMSIECAAIYGKLSNRKVFLYGSKPLQHSDKFFDDLFDCPDDVDFIRSEPEIENKSTIRPYGENVVYSMGQTPEDFLAGRENFIIDPFGGEDSIATSWHMTLAFYSNVFFLEQEIKHLIYNYIKDSFVPKRKYRDICSQIIKSFGVEKFNSIHIRRGDKLGAGQPDIPCQNIIDKIRQSLSPDELLLIHTDERDKAWFSPLLESEYKKILFCEDFIDPYSFDGAESGLVSMMVASHSEDFIGTICSTFTSYINRMRMYNGKREEFKFLFPMMGVSLDDRGCMIYRDGVYSPNKSTWSQMDMAGMMGVAFWAREWPELEPICMGAYKYR